MKKCTEKRVIKVVGIDLGKTSFHLHAVDDRDHTQLTKKLTRKQLKATLVKLPACLVGIEALRQRALLGAAIVQLRS